MQEDQSKNKCLIESRSLEVSPRSAATSAVIDSMCGGGRED